MEKENELIKQDMENKRNIALERQKMASELAATQMDLIRKQ